jgi:hypothetical protein
MQEQNQHQLRESSIPHEYYFGDLPGTLQYKKTKQEIETNLDVSIHENNETCGFVLDFHTEENYRRLVPDTPTGNSGRWRLLLVMRKTIASGDDDIIWLKGALENIDTGDIALMTSTNSRDNLSENRVLRSHDEEWFIGHYRMSAPMVFWRELVNRVRR